ncbi:MAG: hypothetical protein JRI77_09365 [Deltaproteobacteria bacterium]|nr:hypothetical protein [Deltaproteobacteria bacterium]
MNSDSLTRHSLSAINSVIVGFQENPYTFLYESDIQYALFSALRERINGHVEVPGTGGNKYTLHLVYSEYLDKIDIVCIDPEAIRNLDTSSLKPHKGDDTYIYSLPIFLGIELKYIWMGNRNRFNILERDFLKLTKTSAQIGKIKNWVVLAFIQRNEEAHPFLRDTHNQCRLLLLNLVDHLNDIYIVTPNRIYAAQPEWRQNYQEGY